MTLPHTRKYIARSLLIVGLCVVLGYGLFTSRKLISGPRFKVTIEEKETYVTFEGVAQSAQRATVNGRILPLSPKGEFRETLLKQPGYSIITLVATDRFGKTTKKTYHFYSPLEKELIKETQYGNEENSDKEEGSESNT